MVRRWSIRNQIHHSSTRNEITYSVSLYGVLHTQYRGPSCFIFFFGTWGNSVSSPSLLSQRLFRIIASSPWICCVISFSSNARFLMICFFKVSLRFCKRLSSFWLFNLAIFNTMFSSRKRFRISFRSSFFSFLSIFSII